MHHGPELEDAPVPRRIRGPESWLASLVLSFVNFTPGPLFPRKTVSLKAAWIILTGTFQRHLLTWSVLLCNLMWLLLLVLWLQQPPHCRFRKGDTHFSFTASWELLLPQPRLCLTERLIGMENSCSKNQQKDSRRSMENQTSVSMKDVTAVHRTVYSASQLSSYATTHAINCLFICIFLLIDSRPVISSVSGMCVCFYKAPKSSRF